MCPIGWSKALFSVLWEDYIRPIVFSILKSCLLIVLILGLVVVIVLLGISVEQLLEKLIGL